MSIALYIVLAFIAGGAVGFAGHAWLAEEAAATESEVRDWSFRIRSAASSEEKAAREKLNKLAVELERKL